MRMDDIAEVIRFHRKKTGLSQEKLAELAGVGKTVVFDVEKKKKTIRLNTLLSILRVLNISVSLESPLMKEFESLREKSENA